MSKCNFPTFDFSFPGFPPFPGFSLPPLPFLNFQFGSLACPLD